MRHLILAAVLGIALAQTAAAQELSLAPAAPNAPGTTPPLSVWRPTADGHEHLQSGLNCPLQLGALQRVDLATFDGVGLDVACGYNLPETALTLYLTRGMPAERAFEQAKAAVEKNPRFEGARKIDEASIPVGDLMWRRVGYSLPADVRTDIWLAELRGWTLKFRATYPARNATAIETELNRLAEMAVGSAGTRLEVCSRSPAPTRGGREIHGRAANPDILAILALASTQAKQPPTAKRRIVLCLEHVMAEQDRAYLWWRAVTPDGTDAGLDRITLATAGPPPALNIAVDEGATLIAGEPAKGGRRERWTTPMSDGKQQVLFAYYDGRPPIETVAPLFTRVLNRAARPLGAVAADGKVTVAAP